MVTHERLGYELYRKVRDEFIAGESVREIAQRTGMDGLDVQKFLGFIAREQRIERAVRADQLIGVLYRCANEASSILLNEIRNKRPGVDKTRATLADIHKLIIEASKENLRWREERDAKYKKMVITKKRKDAEVEAEEEDEAGLSDLDKEIASAQGEDGEQPTGRVEKRRS